MIKEKTSIGSCKKIEINNKLYNCMNFRLKLGLKSTNFTITKNKDSYLFETLGYGHGVGLSQYGANELSKKGFDYNKIIKHYYTNVEIKKIN